MILLGMGTQRSPYIPTAQPHPVEMRATGLSVEALIE
ncbi:MAG: hypothetical protein A4E50_01364 [Methanosaeta sp. PtaB.Bin087]|nr:MAG: hypothetical protein A4E50_01364 [Methanosaeta sp. PtaB.Bin087]OPY57421.1 MAG: hypothetical protein A4E51_00060 [Methanosaeta sp. PtaU1.Bin055]